MMPEGFERLPAAGELVAAARGARAVLFDVDGTLYAQGPLRALMAAELALEAARGGSPAAARRLARTLRAFRRTRESLRDGRGALERRQYEVVAERLGLDADYVRTAVAEWMLRRPLKHLRLVRRRGLVALLETLERHGVRAGTLSDYPVGPKLDALGVARFFSLGLCTTDPGIDAFKPDPRGFWRACEIWGLAPQEVLYVGDRPDVDGAGAAAAGMRCVIVGRGGNGGAAGSGATIVAGRLDALERAFDCG